MYNRTTTEQYRKMIELIRTKPDIGQGTSRRSRDEVDEFWEKVAEVLNAEGPPIRDAFRWKKQWILWKCYIKRKLAKCKKLHTMHKLTRIEEDVIEVAELDDSKREHSFPDYYEPSSDEETIGMDIEILPPMENDKSKRISHDDEAIFTMSVDHNKESEINLLQQQLDIQKTAYKETSAFQMSVQNELQEIFVSLGSLNESMDRMNDMAAMRLKEEMRHNRKMEKLLQKILVSGRVRRGSKRKLHISKRN